MANHYRIGLHKINVYLYNPDVSADLVVDMGMSLTSYLERERRVSSVFL